MIGGTFTGFSSEQGYGIIVDILRGERAMSELLDQSGMGQGPG